MKALPPVPGFLDPPLKDVGPPPPPLTDANYNLWSIELEDVDADHVRELWIDTVRYSGDLEVRGRWFFRPLRWLDIGPATVSLRALDVAYGMVEPWLSGVTGELTATVHPFALQEVDGADILDRVSIDGDVRGTLQTATVLSRILGSESTVRADDAAVDARMDLQPRRPAIGHAGARRSLRTRGAYRAHIRQCGLDGGCACRRRRHGPPERRGEGLSSNEERRR